MNLTDEEMQEILDMRGSSPERLKKAMYYVEMGKMDEDEAIGFAYWDANGDEDRARRLMEKARDSLSNLDLLDIIVNTSLAGTKKEAPSPPEGDEGANAERQQV